MEDSSVPNKIEDLEYQRSIKITQFGKNGRREIDDIVLVEKPVDIFINSKPLANIISLPKNLKELAIGFTFSIGLINSVTDVDEILIDRSKFKVELSLKNKDLDPTTIDINSVNRVVETSCGISSPWRDYIKKALQDIDKNERKTDNIRIPVQTIHHTIVNMQKNTSLFKETGGCHGAGIFDLKGYKICVMEDIGRHNAIDKAIGYLLLHHKKSEDLILTTTGRLTGDCVLKAIRANIPIIASLSAAIESSIRLAYIYGITLIGFVRGTRMNVYTNPNRIQYNSEK